MPGYFTKSSNHNSNNERLRTIVDSANDAIIAVDDNHRIVYFNPAAERMFRLPAREALDGPLDRLIPDHSRSERGEHFLRAGLTDETGSAPDGPFVFDAQRADGETFAAEATVAHGLARREAVTTLILRDVTARRAREKAEAQLVREVDHRARNLLSIVGSLVTLTRAPTREAYVETLVGRIAAISRAHALLAQQRWQGASLARVTQQELEAHAERDKFSCVGPELQLASSAVQPMSIMLHELASNAVKFGALSVENGHVYLTWEYSGSGAIWLSWREAGGPPATPPRQAGFGSALVKQIIEKQLGGNFRTHWEETGLALMMSLPETVLGGAAQRRVPSEMAPAGPTTEVGGTTGPEAEFCGTLLIVEDEPLLAMQLEKSLVAFGWSVLGIAGSIEDANRILASSPRPDAAILDVDLRGAPVFPLARSLRRSGIPFVFCTGYEDLEFTSEFSDDRAIRKPATALQIVRALRDVVRSSSDQATASLPL